MSVESLLFLRDKLQVAHQLKQAKDKDALEKLYNEELLPHLICLRGQHRRFTESTESKNKAKDELYERLLVLEEACAGLQFEADCLRHDVQSGRSGLRWAESNGVSADHATRMSQLDEEESRRKELQRQLAQISDETKQIEVQCCRKAEQLKQVRPYMEQLLEKAQPVLKDSS